MNDHGDLTPHKDTKRRKKGRGMRSKQKMKERADRFVDTVIPRSLETVANNTGEPMVQSNHVPAMLKQDSTVHLIKTAPADEFHTRP